ncbi:hypothetical protein [Ancylobacter amanitiformis]|uniref:Transcriptional regulator n=1 Tax=Ancylobacter amanitiformis TaxID=217069 RepID=A0ABU0LXT2_9HYPH|nr:hypothetical protein [Ancylobacter amanitiformis]MDQ0513536.1 hypothetical protein [Ancylobacter amanitiformis]
MFAKNFSIKVLGAFDVLDCEGRSVRPSGRKDCALLAMLALSRNYRQTRTWLQERLWGDRGPAQGAASLRQSLTTLRDTFNGDAEALCADRTWVWLDPRFFDFDHIAPGARGEILCGLDLREEGFNDWLRECRAEFDARDRRWGLVEAPGQPDRRWYLDQPVGSAEDMRLAGVCDFICDSLMEALSVIGLHAAIDRREANCAPVPRATDMIVRMRAFRFGAGCAVSLSVTDGFGSLKWQVRREIERRQWRDVRSVQVEIAQLFQDFALRTEAGSLRGARWSAHANGCQALMGMLVPGSVPLSDIVRCSEAAIAASEKGVYHALLGSAHLLLYGEREKLTAPDVDEVMRSIRTALNLSPENGLVQALAGHSYGFVARDLDRNAAMTREAVRLLPGSGACWNYHAISLVYCGRFSEAVRAAAHAVWLCRGTMAQPMAQSTELFARLMNGDARGAIRVGEASLNAMVFRPTIVDLMTAYAREGRMRDGQEKLRLFVRREPELSVDLLKSPDYPIVNAMHRAAVVEAAGQLGLA